MFAPNAMSDDDIQYFYTRLREIELRLATEDGRAIPDRVKDVDDRLKNLEFKVTWYTGAAAGIGSFVGVVVSLLGTKLFGG